ncbi:hypothetical protein BOTBODRAFT_116005 [Botryobasidium botryosum FD-172 SS1]|uniref:Uncharacterized protein n=1 Tax=Botryobasidium botryosum (strain FD-172 SS1) TaxID=930990 RepID=A0A067MEK3_BOTB1|nr:hypothetical protein BOTBODRAFT_116005 [Botryobasidium botryosum FD-172 SS1]
MPLLQSIRQALPSFSSPFFSSLSPSFSLRLPSHPALTRPRTQLAPRRVKYRKAHKGRVPIATGGSVKGTTLAYGDFGLRISGDGVRLTAKQLQSAEVALKRKLKVIKGAVVWMRVFPDIPVCVKGNETRMGKGKGSFEYWACRARTGRVVFELGGGGLREELAREALKLAAAKLPCQTDFITRAAGPRLGNLDLKPTLAVPEMPVELLKELESSPAAPLP